MHLSKLKMTKTLKKDEKLSHLSVNNISLRADTLDRDTIWYPSLSFTQLKWIKTQRTCSWTRSFDSPHLDKRWVVFWTGKWQTIIQPDDWLDHLSCVYKHAVSWSILTWVIFCSRCNTLVEKREKRHISQMVILKCYVHSGRVLSPQAIRWIRSQSDTIRYIGSKLRQKKSRINSNWCFSI